MLVDEYDKAHAGLRGLYETVKDCDADIRFTLNRSPLRLLAASTPECEDSSRRGRWDMAVLFNGNGLRYLSNDCPLPR